MSVNRNINSHADDIPNLIKLIIPEISDGFNLQKGAMFGFGTHAEG